MDVRGITPRQVWDLTDARLAKEIIIDRERKIERLMARGHDYKSARAQAYPEENKSDPKAVLNELIGLKDG